MRLRQESSSDADAIRAIISLAFAGATHSDGTEAAIVDRLRAGGALTIGLVAEIDGALVGHVAFSPVTIDGKHDRWFGLGPVAVLPDRQRQGMGQALIRAGLERLTEMEAAGCVVLGDPGYYGRFGFTSDPALRYADVPPQYFQRLILRGSAPTGTVDYHAAFSGH
jgi:putative acetyltransferase